MSRAATSPAGDEGRVISLRRSQSLAPHGLGLKTKTRVARLQIRSLCAQQNKLWATQHKLKKTSRKFNL